MEEPPKHPAVAALFSELLTATSLNAAGLAKKLGITPQAISNYVVGRNEPGRKMMAAIIKAFPTINAVWLATGEGDPFPHGVHGRSQSLTKQTPPPAAVEEPQVPRYNSPVMRAVPDLSHLTPEQQADYWYKRWEKAASRLAEVQSTQEHEEAVQLMKQAGGRSFKDASAEAADTDTPPVMVASTNHEYVAREAEADRIRIAGFVIGGR